jgi:hypothetical protein
MSYLLGKNRTRSFQSLTIVENDLALCTVVCAHCHLRIAANVLTSPDAMGITKAKDFVALFRQHREYATGYAHAGVKLTPTDVTKIRALHPELSYTVIAKQFGVTKNTIVKVVKRVGAYVT